MLMKILAVIAAVVLLFIMFTYIKGNPESFSKENFSKSLSTMGLLGIGLIAFVAFCVMLLRAG